ncbi:MAG: hypothetical protein RL095_3608 [Verrucomicrobiota bacterium]|jgi:uncharacterized protein (DUF58 family)
MSPLPGGRFGIARRGQGLLLLALGLLAGALSWRDQVLLQMALCLLFLLAFCAFQAWRNGASLSIRRAVPSRLFCGEAFIFSLEIANGKGAPSYELVVEDELLDASFRHGEERALRLDEVPSFGRAQVKGAALLVKRGAYGAFKLRLSSSFPFGLFQFQSECGLESPLIAYPEPALPPDLDDLLAVGQGDGDGRSWNSSQSEFKALREFAPGDALRLIHWPLSVRHQRLVVREFEPASPERLTLLFFSYQGPEQPQPTRAELALRLLAGIFLHLQENGSEATFLADFEAWEPLPISAAEEDVHRALESLAHAEIRPSRDLEGLRSALEGLESEDRRVIIVSNAPVKLWRPQLGDHQAFICLDGRVSIAEAMHHIAERRQHLARTRLEHAEELS